MYGISTLKCNGWLLTVHILQGLFQSKRENCLKTKLSVTKKLNRNTVSGHGLGFIFIDLIFNVENMLKFMCYRYVNFLAKKFIID